MVLVKRTSDGRFNGQHSPAIPRAPRSTRRRGLRQKSLEGGQICAFELLATVAGKLLEETECSSASSSAAVGFDQCGIGKDAIKKEPQDLDKPLAGEHDEQGSSEGSVFFSGLQRDICKGKLKIVNEVIGDHASPFASSACSKKVDSDSKSVIQKNDCEFVKLTGNTGDSPKCGESGDNNVENGMNRKLDNNGGSPGDYNNKSPVLVNSDENVELPLFGDSNPHASFPKYNNDVKIMCKDDDEILSRYSQPNCTMKAHRSPTHAGDSRMRKLLSSSKYWKSGPKLKDCELSNTGGAVKHIYPNKRSSYDLDRSQRNTPFKKRKLFDRSSVVTYDGGISCESVSNSPEKNMDDEKNASAGKLHQGNGAPSAAFERQKSCNSRNSHVRLSIKSFKVPELFIEVPESTTVGSLKRTVLEAVNTVLGGGLRVGVLLQGKKIRDDNRTLLQSGITENDDMDTIGFVLEPNSPTQSSPPVSPEEPLIPFSCASPKFVNRSQTNPKEELFLLDTLDKPSMTDSNSPAASSGDMVPSPDTELADNKNVSDSKALVAVPEASMEALAMVPMNQRSNKRSEIGQRRTRRPFSVTEVEALVQAVEKLGTGRWRDVKLCAFENAKHRTYVDLKDKWKTLVHTARISPQQRRGEPVPQELLDRVLNAQAYWSEHQAKQHGKQQQQAIIPAAVKA